MKHYICSRKRCEISFHLHWALYLTKGLKKYAFRIGEHSWTFALVQKSFNAKPCFTGVFTMRYHLVSFSTIIRSSETSRRSFTKRISNTLINITDSINRYLIRSKYSWCCSTFLVQFFFCNTFVFEQYILSICKSYPLVQYYE